MNHKMKLYRAGFEWIKEWKQTIEVRLNDPKRQQIRIGDAIEFFLLPWESESVKVVVTGLLKYSSFHELFRNIDLLRWNASWRTIEKCIDACRRIYSVEDEETYGVVGIRLEKID